MDAREIERIRAAAEKAILPPKAIEEILTLCDAALRAVEAERVIEAARLHGHEYGESGDSCPVCSALAAYDAKQKEGDTHAEV